MYVSRIIWLNYMIHTYQTSAQEKRVLLSPVDTVYTVFYRVPCTVYHITVYNNYIPFRILPYVPYLRYPIIFIHIL